MEQYIGHIITAVGLIVAGAVGGGVIKNKVDNNSRDVEEAKADLKAFEQRIREVEVVKTQWEEHRQNAGNVMARLNSIDTSIAEIRTKLQGRDQADERLENILETNRIVLAELSQELAVMKALRTA